MKEETEKAGLKLNIQNTKIMAFGSQPFLANRGGNNGNCQTLFSWAPKSLQTVMQPQNYKTLARWKKGNDKPRQSIKRQRHHFASKGLYKAVVFPVVTYGGESWTIKKAERQRTGAFEPWW